MPMWIWFVAAGALGAVELLSGTFYMLVLACAALFGAAAAWAGASLSLQFAAAAAAAVLGCFLVWKRHQAELRRDRGPVSLDEGQTVEVAEWKADGTAEVRYRGAQWVATAQAGFERMPGRWVIVRTEGPRLVIAPASDK